MPTNMARSRALMTETERRRIMGEEEVEDQKVYQAISDVRSRINDQLEKDIAALEEHHPTLLGEVRQVVGPDTEWLRDELEGKRASIEEEFEGAVPSLRQFNNGSLGLWIRVNTENDHPQLTRLLDNVGKYLQRRGYNVRMAYDTDYETDFDEPIYEGHIYALPVEVGIPEYPTEEMPDLTDEIKKHQWTASA